MVKNKDKYKKDVQKALQRLGVPLESEALQDIDEFVAAHFAHQEPSYDDLVAQFGLPIALAHAYLNTAIEVERSKPENPFDMAPGWKLSCTKCGRTRDAAEVGMVRIGAHSKGKYTLGRCSQCQAWRFIRIWRFFAALPSE